MGRRRPSPPPWQERRFPAMGSHVRLVLRGTDADAAWATHRIGFLESRWSRCDPLSDVARANRAAGTAEVVVAPETLDLVADAVIWWHRTDGYFDPTVVHALEVLGHDAAVAEIRVDRAAATLRLPAGVGLDLGGIGAGAAADDVAAGLRARGVTSACVRIGGHVRAFGPGNGPGGRGWAIPVLDPLDDARVLFTQVVHDGAIATSTDRPARTGLGAVVVADRSCARAAVLATAAVVAGRDAGDALLDRFGVSRWFVGVPEIVALAAAG